MLVLVWWLVVMGNKCILWLHKVLCIPYLLFVITTYGIQVKQLSVPADFVNL